MSVHAAISEHSRKQHLHLNEFRQLDELRESFIEEALRLCRDGKPFSVESINEATREINRLAGQGISPVRIMVTEDMVREYALRSEGSDQA